MKKLLVLGLCVLLLTGCAAPAVYDGPTKSAWVLTEQVKDTYSTHTGEVFTDRSTFSYDTFGNQVRSFHYDEGTLSTEFRKEYDDRGNLISQKSWDHDGLFPRLRSNTSYTYDEQNRPLDTIYRNALGLERSRDTYTYDDEAHTALWVGAHDTRTQQFSETGQLLHSFSHSDLTGIDSESFYEYDALGRNIKITEFYDNALFGTIELVYDDQNRIVEEVQRNGDGTVFIHNTFHYTENTITTCELGGTKIIETFRSDGLVEKMARFNDAGELTHVTHYIYQEIQVPANREE